MIINIKNSLAGAGVGGGGGVGGVCGAFGLLLISLALFLAPRTLLAFLLVRLPTDKLFFFNLMILDFRRVVGPALLVCALAWQNVPRDRALRQTVIAHNMHLLILVLLRHFHHLNLHIHMCLEILRVDHRFFTERTRDDVLFHELLLALPVHRVPAPQGRGRISGVEEVIEANRAVGHQLVLHALMRVLGADAHAHAAFFAVKSVLAAANAADAAVVAVEDLLLRAFVVEQVAVWAEVLREDDLAGNALFRWFLHRLAV